MKNLIKIAIGVILLGVVLVGGLIFYMDSQPKEKATTGNASASGEVEEVNNYKDGTYTSKVANWGHGNVQLQVTISGGMITDIVALEIPDDDPTSESVNSYAVPEYIKTSIERQGGQLDTVSGATFTKRTFRLALDDALKQAE